MLNWINIDRMINFIQAKNGINDKRKLSELVQKEFLLKKDRSVFYCEDFAIRFSKSQRKIMSNTVLSLSSLQKYDDIPFIVCIVSDKENYLMLSNTTFLKKISHSSQELSIDKIRGSFNGGDIIQFINGMNNCPYYFRTLFNYHTGFTFEDNLERLVEATNGIVGKIPKLEVDSASRDKILQAGSTLNEFINSKRFLELKNDLDGRVLKVQREIANAAFIDNINVRGRVIEYLITSNDSTLKKEIMDSLNNKSSLPKFRTNDSLGDYTKNYPEFCTETDIKTKIMFLESNPKAYNVDKLLTFLTNKNSIYMIYLIGIDYNKNIICRLIPALDTRLINSTHIIHHWAGRNSRGVAQFTGQVLSDILNDKDNIQINQNTITNFLNNLIDM